MTSFPVKVFFMAKLALFFCLLFSAFQAQGPKNPQHIGGTFRSLNVLTCANSGNPAKLNI